MATIECRWEVPTPDGNRDDWKEWKEARLQAERLPADWKVVVGLGAIASVVIIDGAGQECARLDSISFKSYTTLSAFLARAVPELLKQTPPA